MRVKLIQFLGLGFAVLFAGLLTGCAGSLDPAKVPIPVIDTLTPAFSWSWPNEHDVTFDVVVALGVEKSKGVWIPGKVVFYREGINTTNCAVDKPLAPDTIYVASARTRKGKRTSVWAPYTDSSGDAHFNVISRFRTPKS